MASHPDERVDDNDDQEDIHEEVLPKEKKHDTGSAALEKVTDFAEEKELKSETLTSVRNPYIILLTWKAMNVIQQSQKHQKEEQEAKARSLAAVVIDKSDIDLLVSELDISAAVAEHALRVNAGNVVQTMRKLVH